jgi:hypothetical protein
MSAFSRPKRASPGRASFVIVGPVRGTVMFTCVAQAVMATKVRDFSGKTDKGIALGASLADITRVYGEPDSKSTENGTTHLSYGKLNASFTLFGDRLVQMMFTMPR